MASFLILLFMFSLSSAQEYYYGENLNLTVVPNGIPTTTTHLLLGRNDLPSISNADVSGLNSLIEVYLNDNQITTIATDSFADSTSTLRKLDLSNNLLTSFPIVNGLGSSLTHLNLSGNSISSLPGSLFGVYDAVTHLDLSFNPLPWTTAANFGSLIAFGVLIELNLSGTECNE